MKIHVGSVNDVKVGAVREIILEYPHLKEAVVSGFPADSGISAQPTSLEETVRGAMNRAKAVFADSTYAVGLESGLMQVPYSKGGHMDVCVCAIYDGDEFHLGLSSAWEFPQTEITHMMTEGGLDMSQAVLKAGLTKSTNVGAENGAIGIMTKGRMDRKEYTKQALRTALIHLEQFDF